jgi:cytochrome oxidase assembly protein ShyY1
VNPPASVPRRLAFLLRPGWIAVILAALAFAGACFFLLAPWQFGRNSERSAQNAAITAALTAPAAPVLDLMSTTAPPDEATTWHVATATGTFDPSRQVLVRLRQTSAGQPISEVVIPLRLSTGQTLLVSRGSIPFVELGNPIPDVPAGQVTVAGRVQFAQTDPSGRPPVTANGRTEVYAISSDAIDAAFGAQPGETFIDGYIQLTGDSPGVLAPIEVPQIDSGPFLSYALQWEVFGVVALVGMGVFVVREFRSPRTEDDPVDDSADDSADGADRARPGHAPDPQPVPAGQPRRRRPRDGFDRSQLWDDEGTP